MRIAYLASSIFPSRAANTIQVMKMCQAFARLGHEVTLIGMRDGSEPTDVASVFSFYGMEPVFVLERFGGLPIKGNTIAFAFRAMRRVAALDPDVVYSRTLWGTAFAVARGFRTIYEVHEYSAFRRLVHGAVFRRLIAHPRLLRVVAISKMLSDDLAQHHPALASKITIAHDAADPVNASAQPALGLATRGKLTVGYLGQLYPGKGFEMIAPLAARADYAMFHVVGGDLEVVDRIRQDESLPSNVVMHGFKPYEQALRLRLACDVLIAPMQTRVSVTNAGLGDIARWTSPLKLFEYMAAGKAILCSDLPVLREILTHERTALMLPPNDVNAWAAALERLHDDPELRQRLGSAAREEFLSKYTWTQRAARVLA